MNVISYSIIISACNEELLIKTCITSATEAMSFIERTYDLFGEIVVVDHDSTDETDETDETGETGEIAQRLGANVVFEPINQLARARNTGAKAAQGKFLIFLDADTVLLPELLKESLFALTNQGWCGGSARLSLTGPESGLGRKRFMSAVTMLQKTGVASDCFIFCRKEAFIAVGGFNEKYFAFEEFWFYRSIARWGRRNNRVFRLLDNYVISSSGRKSESQFTLLKLCFPTIVPFFFYSRHLYGFWNKG